MQALAKAVVDALAFLELSDDTTIDPDSAVQAIEDLTATLRTASPAELQAVRDEATAALKRSEEELADPEVQAFYRDFMTNCGLA